MYHLQCQFILDEDHYYQFMEFKKYHQLILLEVNYFQILETINLWRLCIRLSKLISTTPFSLLISSKSRSSGSGSGSGFEKLFVNLVLMGLLIGQFWINRHYKYIRGIHFL